MRITPLLMLFGTGLLVACQAATTSIDLDRTRRLNRALQQQVGSDQAARGLEEGATPNKREPVILQLGLLECQALAMQHNRDLLLEALNAELSRTRVQSEEALTDVVLSANANIEEAESELESRFLGDARDKSKETNYNANVGINAKYFTGTSVDLRHELRKTETNSPFNSFSWSTNTTLTLSQPLLDGWGYVANRTSLDIAHKELTASKFDASNRGREISYDVAEAWWNLVLAEEDLRVIQEQEKTAQLALDRSIERRKRGSDKRLDELRAKSTLKAREGDRIVAELEVERMSDALLRVIHPDLLYGYSLVDGYSISVKAGFKFADELGKPEAAPRLYGELRRAFKQRHDLKAAFLRIQSAGLRVVQRDHNMLPKLDAEISGRLSGLEDDYGDALGNMFEAKSTRITAGLSFEIPFGNTADTANYKSAVVEQDQAITRARQVETTIIIDTLDAIREITSKLKSVEVAKEAADLAQEEYNDVRELRNKGFSTSFEERESEDTLTAAKRDLVRARVELQLARLKLRRATGDLGLRADLKE